MKITTLCLSASIALVSISANAIDLGALAKSSTEELKAVATTAAADAGLSFETSDMIGYAAKQLNISETTVEASLGSLLKAAKDNLSEDSFALISKAVPDAQTYVDKAPEIETSSLSSWFSNDDDSSQEEKSAKYLNSAFDKLGLSSDQIPALVNTFSGYLETAGYGDAAETLKQGLSFL